MIVPPTRTGHARRTAVLTLVTALAFAVLTYGDVADACTCAPPPPPAEAREQSDAVFAGEVLGLTADRPDTWVVARLAVTDVWKGEVREEVDVRTAAQSATCGYSFEVGRADLVYASVGDDDRLVTSLCARTAPVSHAGDDLAALGAPAGPLPRERTARPADARTWTAVGVAGVALGVGGLLAAVTWVARRP